VAFVFTSLGLVCFAAIREPEAPLSPEPRSLGATLASARTILGAEPGFAWYCAARGLASLGLMAAPFLILAIRSGGDGGGRELAHATVAFFVAGTVANLAWGQLADRAGFRAVFLAGTAVWLGALVWVLAVPPAAANAVPIFLLVGAGQSAIQMASVNLVYEFAGDGELGVRIAIVSAVGELLGAVAPLAGGAIADRWSYHALYAAAATFASLSLATMLRGVRPRGAPR
jgi:MFS family permease